MLLLPPLHATVDVLDIPILGNKLPLQHEKILLMGDEL